MSKMGNYVIGLQEDGFDIWEGRRDSCVDLRSLTEKEKMRIREDMMQGQDKRTPDFDSLGFREGAKEHRLEDIFRNAEEAIKERGSYEELVKELQGFELGPEVDEYDLVSNPQHYQGDTMQVIDVIDEFCPDSYSYYMGNVVKYVLRHMNKGKPLQDLEKARWYLDKMIEDWDN